MERTFEPIPESRDSVAVIVSATLVDDVRSVELPSLFVRGGNGEAKPTVDEEFFWAVLVRSGGIVEMGVELENFKPEAAPRAADTAE